MNGGFIDTSAAGEDVSEAIVSLGVFGLDFQSVLEMGDRLIEPSEAGHGQPEMFRLSAGRA